MFERIRYPDGQIGAKYIGDKPRARFGNHEYISPFIIKERINSYEDLFYIRSIADVLNHHGAGTLMYKLFIPCMFGQRSDKRFTNEQSFDLKLITNIINACGFGSVEVFDPHSDVTLALINNSVKVSSFDYVKKAVFDIYQRHCVGTCESTADVLLASPDAGSYKKVFEYGEKLNLPVVAAVKHRDLSGNIDLVFMGDVKGKDCLIVDDLCDGGYTFEVLTKKLKEQGARKVYLYISHGLFSKGFTGMYDAGIDGIYCTNSVKDLPQWVEEDGKIFTTNHLQTDYITQFKII